MLTYKNPFEYEAAINLSEELILDMYIEDFNFTRFIQSTRNVFLLGDRGSGKSMTLLYNSMKLRIRKEEREGKQPSFENIGIYIPCNTPLTHKDEYLLLDKFQASVISEHYLILSIIYSIADTISHIQNYTEDFDFTGLRSEIEYILGDKLPDATSFFESIKIYVQAQLTITQGGINNPQCNPLPNYSFSFASSVLPLLNLIRKIPQFNKSHFLLMIDDAHDLNIYQRRALNSWIAYRDHTLFSFKVAAAKLRDIDYRTSSGGSILEGHDFIIIDMEGDFQNQNSRFGQLAKKIISRRLERANINKAPDDFFPTNQQFLKDIDECKEKVRKEALKKNPDATKKQIDDFVYKMGRAEYFRQRSHKANRPPYSGFDILVHLSTGVIRNLLEPCYWMYDYVYSKEVEKQDGRKEPIIITEISSSVQTEIIIEKSQQIWSRFETGLEKYIENCSKEQAKQIHDLFNNLAVLFRERLLHHKSEPRAIVFTISGLTEKNEEQLRPLIDIARKAQLIYLRTSVAKSDGGQEIYYVPNRMLWPARGLDPQGQHARVSLKAIDIINAANGKKFPYNPSEDSANESVQEMLF